ncbi:hypothetical protein HDU79_002026 [Rhizoclosmatium sp. JEL0117]|nr:hypothetical protein HDU79_002026 [Rhizoclosmatium sp. JEL0117]
MLHTHGTSPLRDCALHTGPNTPSFSIAYLNSLNQSGLVATPLGYNSASNIVRAALVRMADGGKTMSKTDVELGLVLALYTLPLDDAHRPPPSPASPLAARRTQSSIVFGDAASPPPSPKPVTTTTPQSPHHQHTPAVSAKSKHIRPVAGIIPQPDDPVFTPSTKVIKPLGRGDSNPLTAATEPATPFTPGLRQGVVNHNLNSSIVLGMDSVSISRDLDPATTPKSVVANAKPAESVKHKYVRPASGIIPQGHADEKGFTPSTRVIKPFGVGASSNPIFAEPVVEAVRPALRQVKASTSVGGSQEDEFGVRKHRQGVRLVKKEERGLSLSEFSGFAGVDVKEGKGKKVERIDPATVEPAGRRTPL